MLYEVITGVETAIPGKSSKKRPIGHFLFGIVLLSPEKKLPAGVRCVASEGHGNGLQPAETVLDFRPSTEGNAMGAKMFRKSQRPWSSIVVDGVERAPSRAMLRAVGFKDADFHKPQIGVASTRITSYNVCYTKLLRCCRALPCSRSMPRRSAVYGSPHP